MLRDLNLVKKGTEIKNILKTRSLYDFVKIYCSTSLFKNQFNREIQKKDRKSVENCDKSYRFVKRRKNKKILKTHILCDYFFVKVKENFFKKT